MRGRERIVLQLKMKINKTEISCRSERAHTTHEKHPNTFLVDRTDYSFRYHDLDSRTLLNSSIEYYATSTIQDARWRANITAHRSMLSIQQSRKQTNIFRKSNGHRLGCGKSSSFPLDFSTFETLLMVLISNCSQILEKISFSHC